jgi:hypothetical protein
MTWKDIRAFLWSHELFYAVLIFFTLVVVCLLIYFEFFG